MSDTKTLIELIDEYAETRHRCGCATYNAKTEAARKAVIKALTGVRALGAAPAAKFKVGVLVTKVKGSQWTGRVVGTYSTTLTPEGYAVESSTERGSVQIYPAAALELVEGAQAEQSAITSESGTPPALSAAPAGPWSLGEITGNWRDIDLPDHGAVMRIVWKMEGDDGRNAKLEAQAHAVVAALNAASPAPPVEQQAITPKMGNSVSERGAAITSESGTPPAEQPIGEVVVTKTRDGQIVSVTRQDDEGRILSVIATSDPAEQQATTTEAVTPKAGVTTGAASVVTPDAVYADKPDSLAWFAAYGGDIFTSEQLLDFADRTHALRMEQAAPKAAPGVGNSGFDHQTAADFLNGKTVGDEAVRKFVQASRWAHDEKAALSAMLLSVRGELASRNAEIALLKKALMEAEAAPQPAPAPLSDDAKDTARWRWLSEHIGVAWNEGKFTSLVRIVSDKNRTALNASIDRMMAGDWSDAAIAAQGGK